MCFLAESLADVMDGHVSKISSENAELRHQLDEALCLLAERKLETKVGAENEQGTSVLAASVASVPSPLRRRTPSSPLAPSIGVLSAAPYSVRTHASPLALSSGVPSAAPHSAGSADKRNIGSNMQLGSSHQILLESKLRAPDSMEFDYYDAAEKPRAARVFCAAMFLVFAALALAWLLS